MTSLYHTVLLLLARELLVGSIHGFAEHALVALRLEWVGLVFCWNMVFI